MDLVDRSIGAVTVHFGADGGKSPDGNAMVVAGAEETVAIDPALGMIARKASLPRIDRVINSHCHEDHVAGNHLFPEASWHLHEADLPGIVSLDGFMALYGYGEPIESSWRKAVVEQFHFTPRPDAIPFRDGDVFDLGGGVRVTAIHTPGHTRGHCALLAEPDGVLSLGDIELSSFGPYYGDAWSDLEDFERSIERVRELDCPYYATFHHIGVLEGRQAFLERLDRFAAAIPRREARLREFLQEPRSMEEMVGHRIVYRPGDKVGDFADGVERRSIGLHLARWLREGQVTEVEPGRFRASA